MGKAYERTQSTMTSYLLTTPKKCHFRADASLKAAEITLHFLVNF
jgi:ethanolamine utilization microcompartment shell protein EutL